MSHTILQEAQGIYCNEDGARFGYVDTGPHLQIAMDAPTRDEVHAFRKGSARFALLEEGPVLFFLAKFGDMPWWDAPYSMSIMPREMRKMNEKYRPGLRYALASVLADSLSGQQRGARLCTFSAEFSNALHATLKRQQERSIERESYDRFIEEAYRRYPTTESMLSRAVCKSDGGN